MGAECHDIGWRTALGEELGREHGASRGWKVSGGRVRSQPVAFRADWAWREEPEEA